MSSSLLQELVRLTNLPPESITAELTRLLAAANVRPESLELESLRDLLATYAQEVFEEVLSKR